MKRKIISSAIFLLIFCLIFSSLQELLKPKWGEGTGGARETLNANGFYDEPKDSIDVIFYGSSYCFFAVSPLKVWQEYGITSYVRGSANQSMFLTYYTFKESLKYQSPKVVVIEIGQVVNEFDPIKDEWIARRGLDYLRLSDTKAEAILDLDIEGSQQSYMDYFFPLLRYHSRWSDLQFSDFDYYDWEPHNAYKGQYTGVSIYKYQWPEGFMLPTDEVFDIPEKSLKYLDKIAQLCKESGIELVLLKSPMDGWTYAKYNSIQQLADKYEVPYFDYNLPENISAISLNPASDFHYNQWHLRVTGADKLSVHLGKYLKENYDLPDHRDDSAYATWHTDLEQYIELKQKYNLP
jgi:hypothetical protein